MKFPWTGTITVVKAALRSKPSKDSRRPYEGTVKDLVRGTKVEVWAKVGGWLKVQVNLEGTDWTGYVSQELVKPIAGEDKPKDVPANANVPLLPLGQSYGSDKDNTGHVQFKTLRTPKKRIGGLEFLTQKINGTLWYVRLSAYSYTDDFGKMVYEFKTEYEQSLDDYEREVSRLLKQAKDTGIANEHPIIFDVILTCATFGGSRWVKILNIVNLLDGLNPDSPSLTGHTVTDALSSQLLSMLWTSLFRKIGPLSQDWVIELISSKSASVLAEAKSKRESGSNMTAVQRHQQKLDRIQDFRFAISGGPARLEEMSERIKKANAEMKYGKFSSTSPKK